MIAALGPKRFSMIAAFVVVLAAAGCSYQPAAMPTPASGNPAGGNAAGGNQPGGPTTAGQSPAGQPWAAPSGPNSAPVATAGLADPPTQTPKYNFERGRHFGYETKIVAETPEYVKTFMGQSFYRVLSSQGERVTLQHDGQLEVRVQMKTAGMGPGGERDTPMPATFTITRNGQFVGGNLTTPLPHVLGDLETLPIEELPQQFQKQWRVERNINVTESRGSGSFMPRSRASGNMSGAKETIDYALVSVQDDLVTIQKTYRMHSGAETGGSDIQMDGNGQLVFDTRQGLITKVSMRYTVVTQSRGTSETTTLSVDCVPMSAEKLAETAQFKNAQFEMEMRDRDKTTSGAQEDPKPAPRRKRKTPGKP